MTFICYILLQLFSISLVVSPADQNRCNKIFDTVSQRTVYITADTKAVNEGGNAALEKRLSGIAMDSIDASQSSDIIIDFIVETDGSISNERIIKGGRIAKEMISVSKSFKWIPGICNGKKVAMLHQVKTTVCFSEN